VTVFELILIHLGLCILCLHTQHVQALQGRQQLCPLGGALAQRGLSALSTQHSPTDSALSADPVPANASNEVRSSTSTYVHLGDKLDALHG